MQVEELLDLIRNPDKVNTLNRYDLKALLEQYPTFQAARLLLYLIDGDEKVLAQTALHTSNRWVLRQFQAALQDPERKMSAVLEQMHTDPINAFERLTIPAPAPSPVPEPEEIEEVEFSESEETPEFSEPTFSEPESTFVVEEPIEESATEEEPKPEVRSSESSPMSAALAYLNDNKEEEEEMQEASETTLLDDFDLSTDTDEIVSPPSTISESTVTDAENFFDAIADDPYDYPEETPEETKSEDTSESIGNVVAAASLAGAGLAAVNALKEDEKEPDADNFFDAIEEDTIKTDATLETKPSEPLDTNVTEEAENFFDNIEDEVVSDRIPDVPEEAEEIGVVGGEEIDHNPYENESETEIDRQTESTDNFFEAIEEENDSEKETVLVSQTSTEAENFFDSLPDEPYADKQAEVLRADPDENVLDEVLQNEPEKSEDPYSSQDEVVSSGSFFDEVDAEDVTFATPLDDYKGKFGVEAISDSEPIDPMRWAEDEFGMVQSIHQTAVTGEVTRPAWQLISTEDMPGEENRDNLPPEVYQVAVENEVPVKVEEETTVEIAESEVSNNGSDTPKEEGESFFDQF
ncbi:MAG: hypothetical protein AAF740_04925 [Bacteroidota bacterium]